MQHTHPLPSSYVASSPPSARLLFSPICPSPTYQPSTPHTTTAASSPPPASRSSSTPPQPSLPPSTQHSSPRPYSPLTFVPAVVQHLRICLSPSKPAGDVRAFVRVFTDVPPVWGCRCRPRQLTNLPSPRHRSGSSVPVSDMCVEQVASKSSPIAFRNSPSASATARSPSLETLDTS